MRPHSKLQLVHVLFANRTRDCCTAAGLRWARDGHQHCEWRMCMKDALRAAAIEHRHIGRVPGCWRAEHLPSAARTVPPRRARRRGDALAGAGRAASTACGSTSARWCTLFEGLKAGTSSVRLPVARTTGTAWRPADCCRSHHCIRNKSSETGHACKLQEMPNMSTR